MPGITAITGLLSRITPDVPGCPIPFVTQAIQDVIREFCTLTECWQTTLTQNLTADTATYTLTLGVGYTEADIQRIVKIEYDEVELDVSGYEFDGNVTLTLDDSVIPESTVTNGLVTTVVVTPKLDSSTWSTRLMNRYADAIVAGVKARLMDNDKEGWGNPRRAESFKRDYETARAHAKIEAYRTYKTGSLSAQTRSWL